jgi:hypothetical protein
LPILRFWPVHEKLRSTTHLLGNTMKPFGQGGGSTPFGTHTQRLGRFTIYAVQPKTSSTQSAPLP